MFNKVQLRRIFVMIVVCSLMIIPQNPAYAAKQIIVGGLPWKLNQTWRLIQTFHGGSQNALDFATLDGKPGKVYAADSGKVVWAYETCILIKRKDGLELGYQHISKSDIKNWKPGASVSEGTYLGMTTLESGCKGYTKSHHVHFWAQGTLGGFTYGSSIGGWYLDKYTYKYPNGVKEIGVIMTQVDTKAIVCLPNEANCKHDRVLFQEYRN